MLKNLKKRMRRRMNLKKRITAHVDREELIFFVRWADDKYEVSEQCPTCGVTLDLTKKGEVIGLEFWIPKKIVKPQKTLRTRKITK